ncbi:hypothetical protein ACQEU8_33375 [Streptomyces sp. CA-250714]|uniref:hypothetical protein n=1 Tax=Streptomyces sp. CA-250714 TaxID=3240060 RepID=UPI003D8E8FCE
MTLPRTYWCHMDYTNPHGSRVSLRGTMTPDPAQAVTWLRETARDIVWMLDRAVFAQVWAWLGDHPGAAAAVSELRSGRLYDFQFGLGRHQWTLLAHPVSRLPLLAACPRADQTEAMSAAACGAGP